MAKVKPIQRIYIYISEFGTIEDVFPANEFIKLDCSEFMSGTCPICEEEITHSDKGCNNCGWKKEDTFEQMIEKYEKMYPYPEEKK